MTEDEMVRWHHQLDGHELEQAPGISDAHNTQGSLVCYTVHGIANNWIWLSNWTELWEVWCATQSMELQIIGYDWATELNWGKVTRPFRYDLNQIPYDYTLEVMNRFKGLSLVDRVPEELWTEVHNIVQEAVMKTVPKKNKCKEAKW